MYKEVYRLYRNFLTDEKGNNAGTISFEEIVLSPTVKEELLHTSKQQLKKVII
jgi:hypothetical protein